MIVCHCNVITESHIREAVAELLAADPFRVLTPGYVYRALGKKGRCCGCFPTAIDVIRRAVTEFGGTLQEEVETSPLVAASRDAA